MSYLIKMKVAWVLLPLLAFAFAPAWAGQVEWVEVRSPNFSVVTDAGEKRGREVALHFEQMRAVFGALMTHGAKVNLPIPLQIVAFRNSKEMRQFVPLWKGRPTDVAGLFQSGEDRCFIMLDMSVENPWQVVFHEYAHQLMNGNLQTRVDPWFEEGFAEYFSSITVDGRQASVGKIPDETYQILAQTGMMKVFDLFRVQQNSSVYNESGDHRTVFYAESSLLVHYIYDNQWVPKLGTYFDLVKNQKVSPEDAISKAFGMSAAQFDKELRSYLNSGRYKYYPIPTPAGIASSGYNTKPVTPLDAQVVMADMHQHSADYRDKAMAEFEEVLKQQPENAGALRGMGYGYLIKQDYQHAGDYFTKAAEHDLNDSRALYYSAILAQREIASSDHGRDGAELMQKWLEKAVTLDPEFADAYNLLAFAYMRQGKQNEAMQTMMKAANLNPRNDGYIFNLAGLCLAMRKFDHAIKLLESLQASSSPEVAAQAGQALAGAREAKRAATSNFDAGPPPVAAGAMLPSGTPVSIVSTSASVPVAPAPVRFLKGKLVAVDCSALPSALLKVVAGSRTWKFRSADAGRLIVIGADNLSCDWSNQNVAINYRETGDGAGEIISLEIQ
jgi:tetratricopeptide (TPR) repeat protein